MGHLFYLSLLALVVLCSATTIDLSRSYPDDQLPNFQFPRRDPRRPPPPFDIILRPFRPYPPPIRSPTTSTQDTTTTTTRPPTTSSTKSKIDSAVVLYKLECDPCMPGWGVKSMCNATWHTVCMPCPLGTWSPRVPHYRSCMPCSKCGRGLYEKVQCTSTQDTKCDSCSNIRATINENFMHKCNWRQVVDALDDADGKIDIEVIDLQSKELDAKMVKDSDPDVDSNEDEQDDDPSMTIMDQATEEMDITVDDPEIDSDLPADKTEQYDSDDDVSKENEEEWKRHLAWRNEAREEIGDFNDRLQTEKNIDDDADDDDKDDAGGSIRVPLKRVQLRPIRPLPQQMPAPERTIHVEPESDIVRPIEPPVNIFPPSFHNYPIDSLAHAGETQRRKAIVLVVLVCAIIVSTVVFIGCYVREYRRRVASYNRVVVVNLTPEEREIVRQSAHKLEAMVNGVKKYKTHGNGYSPIISAESQSSVYITENPLEAYLNSADEAIVEKENLVDNEVLEPKVHRQNATQA